MSTTTIGPPVARFRIFGLLRGKSLALATYIWLFDGHVLHHSATGHSYLSVLEIFLSNAFNKLNKGKIKREVFREYTYVYLPCSKSRKT